MRNLMLQRQISKSKYNLINWHQSDDAHGGLDAVVLRYNADNFSTTLKLWEKMGENTSRFNTFPYPFPTFFHFTRQNTAYWVTGAVSI